MSRGKNLKDYFMFMLSDLISYFPFFFFDRSSSTAA
jgi:hypothetical protein